MHAFVAVLLTVAALLSSGKGAQAADRLTLNGVAPLPSRNTQKELQELHEGQTLVLQEHDLSLSATIYVDVSNVEIDGAEDMTYMHCPEGGSAFVIRGKNVTLRHMDFTGCTGGPAVTVEGGDDTLSCSGRACASGAVRNQVTGTGGSSDNGGAISVDGGQLTTINCTFIGNSAARSGGAIFAVDSTVDIEACTFRSNTAGGLGGGLAASRSRVFLRTSVFDGNNASSQGGSVFLSENSVAQVTDTNFSNSSARFGGAWFMQASEAEMDNVVCTNNSVVGRGGAVRPEGSNLTIANSVFTSNSAEEGGAMASRRSNVSVSSTTFSENSARQGGAVFLSQESNVTVADSLLSENIANQVGGALRLTGSSNVAVTNSEFRGNSAGRGGALEVLDGSNAAVVDSRFLDNSAGIGSGVRMVQSIADVRRTTFTNNVARDTGGAVDTSESEVNLVNVACTSNSATRGGALHLSLTNARIMSSSFTGNVANVEGGALRLIQTDVILEDVTFVNNTAPEGATMQAFNSTVELRLDSDNQPVVSGAASKNTNPSLTFMMQ